LGNALLKRFNIILDNKNGFTYLKPNSLMKEPFYPTEFMIYAVIAIVVIVLACILVITLVIHKKQIAKKQIL